MIAELLKKGKLNTTDRDELCTLTGLTDREVRRAIQSERRENVILNTGNGYFIPTADDVDELRAYCRQERARATTILYNLNKYESLLSDYEKERILQ